MTEKDKAFIEGITVGILCLSKKIEVPAELAALQIFSVVSLYYKDFNEKEMKEVSKLMESGLNSLTLKDKAAETGKKTGTLNAKGAVYH